MSGILAVVGAGLVIGNYGRPRGMSERTQAAATSFWDAIAFLLNSVIFLLIGIDLPLTSLLGSAGLVVAGFAIVTLARAVAVHGLVLLLRPFGRAVNYRWQLLISWSGLRGAVAIALLLSLEDWTPRRCHYQADRVWGRSALDRGSGSDGCSCGQEVAVPCAAGACRVLRTAEPGPRSGLQLRGAIRLYRARALRVGGQAGVDSLDLSTRSDERSIAPGGAHALFGRA